MFFQIRHQVVECLDVGVHALLLRIGYEHDGVDATQNQLAAGGIKNLPWYSVKGDAGLEATHRTKIKRQEIEEQGSIGLRGQGDHLALLLFGCFLEDELQIRRLAAQPGAIVDDLAVDLARCEIDETQKASSEGPAHHISRTSKQRSCEWMALSARASRSKSTKL